MRGSSLRGSIDPRANSPHESPRGTRPESAPRQLCNQGESTRFSDAWGNPKGSDFFAKPAMPPLVASWIRSHSFAIEIEAHSTVHVRTECAHLRILQSGKNFRPRVTVAIVQSA